MPIITCNIKRTFVLENSFKSTSLSLIRLWGNVVYNVKKSYVDRLDLLNTSHEFLIDQKDFFTIYNNMIFDSSKTRG